MKFLILAACVCMAVTLPQRGVKKAATVAASPSVAASTAASTTASTSASTVASTAASKTVSAAASNANSSTSPRSTGNTDEVLHSESDVRADGYSYSYETSNGIEAESSGSLKKIGEISAVVVTGSYQYIDADGNTIKVTYIADENGFQPESDVLPTPPPTPRAILAALKHIKEHPYTEPKVDSLPDTEPKKVKSLPITEAKKIKRSKATSTRNPRRLRGQKRSLHATQEGQKH